MLAGAGQDPVRAAMAEIAARLRQPPVTVDVYEKWRTGDLRYKLRAIQPEMADVLSRDTSKKIINCSRQIGKSFTCLTANVEICLREKNAQIRYAAATQKALEKIIHPNMKKICADAPAKFKPVWRSQGSYYFFPSTGSEIHVAGCDKGHEENLRGTAARRCVVDEAQAVPKLKYVVQDIFLPQLLTTRGDLVIIGTPPTSPVQDFGMYILQGRVDPNVAYAEFTLDQSGYPQEVIDEMIADAGGRDSTTVQREFYCKLVVDKDFQIIPEWSEHYKMPYVPTDFYRFYHKYVGIDVGRTHFTAALFATYDFKNGKLYVQDEFVVNGPKMTTQVITDGIAQAEKNLWGEMPVYRRVSDSNNPILIQDMNILHKKDMIATSKDSLIAMVNKVRLWVGSGRVIVDPKCRQLIGCLGNGVWKDNNRQAWAETPYYGHFDALAALMYLIRNIDESTNPIPAGYGFDLYNQVGPPQTDLSAESEKWRQVLQPRRLRR